MPKYKNNSKKVSKPGFTIIEVVLVLAIAGLIFMMVFLALPALQRSQKDTQRRDDMARFAAQVAQYQANNRGNVPNAKLTKNAVWVTSSSHADTGANVTNTLAKLSGLTLKKASTTNNAAGTWGGFLDSYMWAANDDFTDPGGTPYAVGDHGKITAKASLSLNQMDFIIHVYHGATCATTEGTVDVSTSGSTRKLAFLYKLEGAGYYCGEV